MSEEHKILHEAQRLLQAAYDEKASEEKRFAYLEKQVFDSWTLKLSNLTDSVITSEKLRDFKLAERAKQKLQDAIQQHKKARQWDQIRVIRDHLEALETLIEVREYVVDRLMMRVDETEEELEGKVGRIEMRDTEMEGEMRSGSGARAEWGSLKGEGRREVKAW